MWAGEMPASYTSTVTRGSRWRLVGHSLPSALFPRAGVVDGGHGSVHTLLLRLLTMATAHSEPLSQRLAAIREQLKLLSDYL
jgi:hypothetical protein